MAAVVRALKQKCAFGPFYSGGKIKLSSSEEFLLCAYGTVIHKVDVATGQVTKTLTEVTRSLVASVWLTLSSRRVVISSRWVSHWTTTAW